VTLPLDPAFSPLWPEVPYRRLLQACGVEDPLAWQERWRQHPDVLSVPPDPRWAVVLPLLSRCQGAAGKGKRLLIGLNAPVGAGKSSLGAWLSALAPVLGLRLSSLSIDDFYWPWQERISRMAGNPFGVDRVPPGSHDADLLAYQLASWRQDGVLRWPRFDKRLRQGRGDRSAWSAQQADVVLLEGWMIGCRAIGPAALAERLERLGGGAALGLTPEEQAWLPRWDAALLRYAPVWAQLDGLWLMRPLDWSWPRRWRFQAEARQRRLGGSIKGSSIQGREVQRGSMEVSSVEGGAAEGGETRRASAERNPGVSAAAGGGDAGISGSVYSRSSEGPRPEGTALCGADLERLVRASLCSLPPALYQDPLIWYTDPGDQQGVEAVGLLDGRRRFRWLGTGEEARLAVDQLSSVSALSSIG
jgi:D-glycerate 3-kinase